MPKLPPKVLLFDLKIRPRAGWGPPQGRVGIRCVCGVSFQHAPFPAVNLVFAVFFFFSRRIPSWIPPFPSLVGRKMELFLVVLVGVGVLLFRYVFWACFLTIFDAFLVHFWDEFYMFFAYLFEHCFCLLFPRMFFKRMDTFQTRDLQKTLFFSSKNAILEDPPLQKKFENLHFWGWDRALFFA